MGTRSFRTAAAAGAPSLGRGGTGQGVSPAAKGRRRQGAPAAGGRRWRGPPDRRRSGGGSGAWQGGRGGAGGGPQVQATAVRPRVRADRTTAAGVGSVRSGGASLARVRRTGRAGPGRDRPLELPRSRTIPTPPAAASVGRHGPGVAPTVPSGAGRAHLGHRPFTRAAHRPRFPARSGRFPGHTSTIGDQVYEPGPCSTVCSKQRAGRPGRHPALEEAVMAQPKPP